MIKQWLWKNFKNDFLQLHAREQAQKINHAKLEPAFLDLQGRQYYAFPEDLSIPMERLGQLKQYMAYMSAGITGEDLDFMIDEADKLLTDGLKNGKNAAKIGMILQEIRHRRKMHIPTELMYNYLAVQIIREDEEIETFNKSIHMEKVAAFKELAKETGFFFQRKELRILKNWLTMSESEWMEYFQNSLQEHKKRIEALRIVLSGEQQQN